MNVSLPRRFFAFLVSLVLLLSGCSTGGTETQSTSAPSADQVPSTVTVEKRQIVPTLSAKTSVDQASSFVISATQRGPFESAVKVNDVVKAGTVLGWNNGAELISPVDAVVRRIAEKSGDLPAHYPVFELEYQGFALTVEASALLAVASLDSLGAKFQIDDGIGPTDVQAIVASPGEQEPASSDPQTTAAGGEPSPNTDPTAGEDPGEADSGEPKDGAMPKDHVSEDAAPPPARPRVSSQTVLCLIGKDQPVRPGQVATVVLTGQAKTDVVAVPVNAVAGRIGKGSVTLVKDGASSTVEVSLGVSDGAYIEVTSGLAEGDVISATAPYLDPRKK